MRVASGSRRINFAAVMWSAVLISLAVWVLIPSYEPGYDVNIYKRALVSMRLGHDAYGDGIAVQRAFHAKLASHPHAIPPYSYVYSPITLPVMRWIARWPFRWSAGVYWALYAMCDWIILQIGLCAAEGEEKQLFKILAPVSIFFPGLLHHDTILSGNVAFLLYGAALGTAWLGWRRKVWAPFYVAVVLASCVKAPLLSLLAIPVLSARRQWLPAGLSALVGVALFAVQPHLWPAAFHHYLEAVELQFSFNRDFSSSPAGVMADLLFTVVSYKVTSAVAYVAYAVPVSWVLLRLSRRYLEGYLRFAQWLPVLLLGVILLNPRIMEYDLAPVALPMAFLAWRLFARKNTFGRTLLEFALALTMMNAFAISGWKPTESVMLLTLFVAGAIDLFHQSRGSRRNADTIFQTEPSMVAAG